MPSEDFTDRQILLSFFTLLYRAIECRDKLRIMTRCKFVGYLINVVFDNAAGLDKDASVQIAGVEVGR
ncbi:MAG: hypothetical protein QMD03_04470 [Syntrophales bacterium]|nr:hypothetical protein [Syntrophales bacterium]